MDVKMLLSKCSEIHERKAHDYSSAGDKHKNFKFVEKFVGLFNLGPQHLPYLNLLGVKLARLDELLQGKYPLNESIEDSFADAINYIALWQERVLNCEPQTKQAEQMIQHSIR